jgi:hypothetical protein
VAALIAAQRDERQIPHAVACRALGVSRSWFYKWKDHALAPRAARREALAAEVRRLFKAHRGTYGSPRITADLREAGWAVSKNTVAAIMREQGLAARRKKKRRSTTRPGRGRWRAPDLVRRDFPAQQVNRKWYGDGTEIPTGEGKLYLASVMDMASRRVLGHALGEHHDAALAWGYRLIEAGGVLTALAMLLPWPAGLGRPWPRWAAAVLLGAGPFIAYIASRTAGVPGDPGDVGNWGNWVGTVSLFVEAALVSLSATMLLALRRTTVTRMVTDYDPDGHVAGAHEEPVHPDTQDKPAPRADRRDAGCR